MQTYEITVQNRTIRGNSSDMTLVRTSVGIDRVHVLFDSDEWLEFPLTITFAQGGDVVTQSLVVSEVTWSDKWSAEAMVEVPYEVVDMVGPIRVTLQGTDSEGRHIITAKGAPLRVEEAGDVAYGTAPSDAPTMDQWQQAYSDACVVINEVQGIINNLDETIGTIVSSAESRISSEILDAAGAVPGSVVATADRLGVVRIGSGLGITDDGVLSASETNGITTGQANAINNLSALAYYCFNTTFSADGSLQDDATVKPSALPLSDIVDGTTISVVDGKLSVTLTSADETEY